MKMLSILLKAIQPQEQKCSEFNAVNQRRKFMRIRCDLVMSQSSKISYILEHIKTDQYLKQPPKSSNFNTFRTTYFLLYSHTSLSITS